MEEDIKLLEYFEEFMESVKAQLRSDNERWGDTYLNRTKEGQEERTRHTYMDYFDQFENAGTSVPWEKVVGGAFICWLRENHSELSENWS